MDHVRGYSEGVQHLGEQGVALLIEQEAPRRLGAGRSNGQCYVEGVYTRRVDHVLRSIGIEGISMSALADDRIP